MTVIAIETLSCSRPGCLTPPGRDTRGECERHYRQRVRMRIYGYRDAAPAREHVEALRNLGWTYEQIAAAAQVSTWVPHKLATGVTHHLLPESERAILAVSLEPRESQRSVDSTGTRRRVQALAWMGWPAAEIARRVGTTQPTLATLIRPHRRISYRLARRVAAVYDELSHLPGPSRVAAGKARSLGHAPPAAWDDETIDDPRVKPCGVRRPTGGGSDA